MLPNDADGNGCTSVVQGSGIVVTWYSIRDSWTRAKYAAQTCRETKLRQPPPRPTHANAGLQKTPDQLFLVTQLGIINLYHVDGRSAMLMMHTMLTL